MSIPSEQWVANALRRAAYDVVLPPESRWIRERTPRTALSATLLVLTAALFIMFAGGVITAVRAVPRIVPATRPDPLALPERQAWARVHSDLPADDVLRPTWLPAGFRLPSAECTSLDVQTDPHGHGYAVQYLSKLLPGGECGTLTFRSYGPALEVPEAQTSVTRSGGAGAADDAATRNRLNARGTVIYVAREATLATGALVPAHADFYLDWIEGGVWYEIRSNDAPYADLVAVLRSLQPMR